MYNIQRISAFKKVRWKEIRNNKSGFPLGDDVNSTLKFLDTRAGTELGKLLRSFLHKELCNFFQYIRFLLAVLPYFSKVGHGSDCLQYWFACFQFWLEQAGKHLLHSMLKALHSLSWSGLKSFELYFTNAISYLNMHFPSMIIATPLTKNWFP